MITQNDKRKCRNILFLSKSIKYCVMKTLFLTDKAVYTCIHVQDFEQLYFQNSSYPGRKCLYSEKILEKCNQHTKIKPL